MQGFNRFVANKLDLWPETGTGGLMDPLRRWKCDMHAGLKT